VHLDGTEENSVVKKRNRGVLRDDNSGDNN
jgi:hypothetical protein